MRGGNLRLTPGGTLVGQEYADLETDAREKPRCHIANTEKDGLHEGADDEYGWKRLRNSPSSGRVNRSRVTNC